jgi:hypothetical protein
MNGFLSEKWLASQDAYFKWRRKCNTATASGAPKPRY